MPRLLAILPADLGISVILHVISKISSANWLPRFVRKCRGKKKEIAAGAISQAFNWPSHRGRHFGYSNHDTIS